MCDRTLEFNKFVSEKRIGNGSGTINGDKIPPTNVSISSSSNREDAKSREAFHQLTLEISKGIQDSAGTLSKLTKLVRQQGLFDDPTEEINKLIHKINQDLKDLGFKCDAAQQNVEERKRQWGERSQTNAHSNSVVTQLKSGLMAATKDFKSALEIRSFKMKDTQNRKNQIGGIGILSPVRQFVQQQKTNGATAEKSAAAGGLPTPYSTNSSKSSAIAVAEEDSMKGVYQSPRGVQMQEQQLLLAPPSSAQYYEHREIAVNEVEKTIGELGTLFKRLGSMLMEQQELIERIDEDIESAVETAEQGRNQLQKQYDSVSSNRGLYTKLISILVLFILFFVIFLM